MTALDVTVIAIGIAISTLSLASSLLFLLLLKAPRCAHPGVATLILPLTGAAPQLGRLVAALETQTLPPRRLVIAVESRNDPAYRRACDVAGRCRLPIEIVVAGLGSRCAQKCTNQIAALRRIDASDEAIVLLDADIEPPPWWLSALVSPLIGGECDLVNGYRWPLVERSTLGAHLVASIDRSIGILPRMRWARAAWGGSLSMSRRAFEALDLREALGRTLSDDFTIAARAADLGLRVLTRRMLMVPSPLSFALREAWRFGRRQYQIVRIHRPRLWLLALATITLRLAAVTAVGVHLASSSLAQAAALALIALACMKQAAIQAIGARLGAADRPSVRAVQFALAAARPLVDLFHLSMIAAAAGGRYVTWGHVRYRVRAPDDVAVAQRTPCTP